EIELLMSQHIGIVACSAEGAALCYRTICLEGTKLMGRHGHPEVSLHTHSLADYMKCIEAGDWAGVAGLMMSSAEKLARAGADFLVCPDNTIHQAFDFVQHRSPGPGLHGDPAAGHAGGFVAPDVGFHASAGSRRAEKSSQRIKPWLIISDIPWCKANSPSVVSLPMRPFPLAPCIPAISVQSSAPITNCRSCVRKSSFPSTLRLIADGGGSG